MTGTKLQQNQEVFCKVLDLAVFDTCDPEVLPLSPPDLPPSVAIASFF